MSKPLRVVLATANPHKTAEIRAVLDGAVELVARPAHVPEVAETENTFVGNARLKAVALIEATGLAAVADDTGLEVDALGGEPGVHSAYYAGPTATYAENVAKVLRNLVGVPIEGRAAALRTVALLRFPDGEELIAHGEVRGRIVIEPRGTEGWGFDPIFEADEAGGRTFSEMSAAEKNALSHRGRAFSALRTMLEARDAHR